MKATIKRDDEHSITIQILNTGIALMVRERGDCISGVLALNMQSEKETMVVLDFHSPAPGQWDLHSPKILTVDQLLEGRE